MMKHFDEVTQTNPRLPIAEFSVKKVMRGLGGSGFSWTRDEVICFK